MELDANRLKIYQIHHFLFISKKQLIQKTRRFFFVRCVDSFLGKNQNSNFQIQILIFFLTLDALIIFLIIFVVVANCIFLTVFYIFCILEDVHFKLVCQAGLISNLRHCT